MAQPLFNKSDLIYYRTFFLALSPLVGSLLFVLGTILAFGAGNIPLFGWLALVLLILLGASATIMVASIVLRRMMRPLAVLARAMQRLGAGASSIRVQEISAGEMGQLERGFNAMSSRIMSINEELQNEVEQATAELQETLEALEIRNAELDIARKRALEANRVKSDFLANMSHEIRTPMNGIIGFTDLLAKTPLQGHQTEYLNTIHRSAESLLGIIDNILEYAALESGELKLQQAPFDLRDTIEDALQLHVPQAHAKRLEMVSLVYNDVPDRLVGDRTRLVQILSNLLSNAVKFTASGEVVLRVMLEQQGDHQVTLGFTVTDTGIGIPASEQSSLFEAFAQGSLTTKRVFGGAGLGLSLCQVLARAMGGDISVSSVQGEGSTFQVSLVLGLAADATDAIHPAYQGKRVLLIEPHSLSRIALRNQLGELGFLVEEKEALADADTLEPPEVELAVLGIGGFDEQLAEAQRQLSGLRQLGIPSLALVSSCDPLVTQQMREAGAGACLGKPVRRLVFQDAIATLLSDSAPADVAGTPAPDALGAADKVAQLQPLSGMRCLAADDNPVNLLLLTRYIESMGGEAVTAENGQQALEICRDAPIDIAFLDVHMPVMNGLDAARGIRELYAEKKIPLVALTADVAEQNTRDIVQAGFDVHLTKPVTEAQIVATVQALLKGETPSLEDIQPAAQVDTTSDSLPIRDHQQSLRISGGSEAVAAKLFNILLAELPGNLQNIHQAFDQQDWDAMWHEAHKLHGATAVCAVPALQEAVSQLEATIKLGDAQKTGQQLARMQREANRLVADAGISSGGKPLNQ